MGKKEQETTAYTLACTRSGDIYNNYIRSAPNLVALKFCGFGQRSKHFKAQAKAWNVEIIRIKIRRA